MTHMKQSDPSGTDRYFKINHSLSNRLLIRLMNLFIVILGKPVFFLLFGFRVCGRKNLRKAKKGIIVSNHCLITDAYFIGTSTWPRQTWYAVESNNILRKDVGWLNRLNGAFGIPDAYPMAISTSVREAMTRNEYVTIFPEGRQVNRNQQLIPFHKGGFYIALENEVPIIPMAEVLRSSRFQKRFPWIPPRVRLIILDPIETKDFGDPDVSLRKKSAELADLTRMRIQETIDREGGEKDLYREPLFQ